MSVRPHFHAAQLAPPSASARFRSLFHREFPMTMLSRPRPLSLALTLTSDSAQFHRRVGRRVLPRDRSAPKMPAMLMTLSISSILIASQQRSLLACGQRKAA